jgi:uncharacterized damage-inducible protein DinB
VTDRRHPPVAADEATTLLAFLDLFRDTLRRQTEGLDAAQLRSRLGPSTLTLGSLLTHLAFVEGYWIRYVLIGGDPSEPWATADWDTDPDWDFHTAAERSPEELRALYDGEVAACDALLRQVVADDGLDRPAARARHGEHPSLRWILVHLVEEYARHCGHADLIRESVDGAVDL